MTGHPIPIVDTHQHLWDLTRFDLPWLQNPGTEHLRRSFVMSDYVEATRGLNVTDTIYMEVDLHPDQQVQEAEYVIDLCRRDDNPMRAAVISGRPESARFGEYIERFSENQYVKGVRRLLHVDETPPGHCLTPQFVENVRLLGEIGLSFDLCLRPGEILDGVKLVEQCPRTRFIVDHCGNMSVQPDQQEQRALWMQGMREMAQQDHVICKISGIVVTAEKGRWSPADLAPNVDFCLDTFGEDRVLFGGDWPVCTKAATFREWVEALRWIVRERSAAFQRKLFHDNAVRWYGLTP